MNPLGPIGAITKATADHYGVSMADLRGKALARRVSNPRRLAMATCRSFTKASLPQIGTAFGGRHHTTVLYAVRQFNDHATPEERAAAIEIARRAGVLKGDE